MIAEPALELYRVFSPRVVQDMNSDRVLREAMRLYAVVPVFHLVNLAETYLASDADTLDVILQLDRIFDEYLDDIKRARGSALLLADAAEDAFIASRLLSADHIDSGETGSAVPRIPFQYLAAAIMSAGSPSLVFAWALEGVGLFLREAAAKLERGTACTPGFLPILGAWICRLPIPPADRLRISDARQELKLLATHVFKRPDLLELFGQHLLARWPAPASDLSALLEDLRLNRISKGEE